MICFVTWTEADRQTHLKQAQLSRAVLLHAEEKPRLRPGFDSADSIKPGTDVQADMGATVTSHSRRVGGLSLLPRRRGGTGQLGLPDMFQEDEGARARITQMPSSAGSPNLLASFAGKNRVLVISAPHEADGYYRLMMSLLKPEVYCELAERHVHQIVMFHQEGDMGGKVRRITAEGKVLEEPLDIALIPRLMSFLKLEKGE